MRQDPLPTCAEVDRRWPDARGVLDAVRAARRDGSQVVVTRVPISDDWQSDHDDADLRRFLLDRLGSAGWSLTAWHVHDDVPDVGAVAYGAFEPRTPPA